MYSTRVFEALEGNTKPELLKRLRKYSTSLVDARLLEVDIIDVAAPESRVYFRYDVMAQPPNIECGESK
jgi:hypothetical protein